MDSQRVDNWAYYVRNFVTNRYDLVKYTTARPDSLAKWTFYKYASISVSVEHARVTRERDAHLRDQSQARQIALQASIIKRQCDTIGELRALVDRIGNLIPRADPLDEQDHYDFMDEPDWQDDHPIDKL